MCLCQSPVMPIGSTPIVRVEMYPIICLEIFQSTFSVIENAIFANNVQVNVTYFFNVYNFRIRYSKKPFGIYQIF